MTWQEIHELDQQVTLAMNNWHSGITDPIMQFFSNIPIWIPMYVIVAVFLFVRLGWKKAIVVTVSVALTFLLCDQFANLIKNSVGRLRPCHDEWMLAEGLRMLEGKGGLYGFFSGHSSNSFGFAVSTYLGFKNDKRLKYRGYATWIFFWAFMVSASRIFVGKHYLGDVLVGIAAGSLIGLACAFAARAVIRKFIDGKKQR